RVRRNYNDAMYAAAWNLSDLGKAYVFFEVAFSMATAGLITLSLDGKRIRPSGPLLEDSRFEAYDHLVAPRMRAAEVGAVDESFLKRVDTSVRVRGASFTYQLNPSILQAGMEALKPAIECRFGLPSDWIFPEFSLIEFRSVASVLWT